MPTVIEAQAQARVALMEGIVAAASATPTPEDLFVLAKAFRVPNWSRTTQLATRPM